MKLFFLYVMAILYVLAGINHFRDPAFYLQMMPPFLPQPEFLILISGVVEVILGLLLFFKKPRRFAAGGIILLLIAVFPANIYMYLQGPERYNTSGLILLLRLPLQFLLMSWAALYVFRKNN